MESDGKGIKTGIKDGRGEGAGGAEKGYIGIEGKREKNGIEMGRDKIARRGEERRVHETVRFFF